jgi:hypothetical protein
MPKEILLSTGEVAKQLGVSDTYVKITAQNIGLAAEIAKIGLRGDWVWTKEQMELLRPYVHKRD